MIAVDWGTSNLRAYRLDAAGQVVDHAASASGITRVAAGGFAATLLETVGPWLRDGERHVLLCGMVGSRQGWIEAPYLPCPASPAAIAAALVEVKFEHAQVLLVPGLSARDASGTPEVMRGEETKLVGLMATQGGGGVVCMPGSHTKWAHLVGGRIAGFATYFTGEAFAALRDGTILGRMMARTDEVDPDGFRRGVARSGDEGHLLHRVQCRGGERSGRKPAGCMRIARVRVSSSSTAKKREGGGFGWLRRGRRGRGSLRRAGWRGRGSGCRRRGSAGEPRALGGVLGRVDGVGGGSDGLGWVFRVGVGVDWREHHYGALIRRRRASPASAMPSRPSEAGSGTSVLGVLNR